MEVPSFFHEVLITHFMLFPTQNLSSTSTFKSRWGQVACWESIVCTGVSWGQECGVCEQWGGFLLENQCGKELISWMVEREAHIFVFWKLRGMPCSQYLLFLSCIGKKRLLYMWFISPIVLRAFQGSHQEMGRWCGPPVTTFYVMLGSLLPFQ